PPSAPGAGGRDAAGSPYAAYRGTTRRARDGTQREGARRAAASDAARDVPALDRGRREAHGRQARQLRGLVAPFRQHAARDLADHAAVRDDEHVAAGAGEHRLQSGAHARGEVGDRLAAREALVLTALPDGEPHRVAARDLLAGEALERAEVDLAEGVLRLRRPGARQAFGQ